MQISRSLICHFLLITPSKLIYRSSKVINWYASFFFMIKCYQFFHLAWCCNGLSSLPIQKMLHKKNTNVFASYVDQKSKFTELRHLFDTKCSACWSQPQNSLIIFDENQNDKFMFSSRVHYCVIRYGKTTAQLLSIIYHKSESKPNLRGSIEKEQLVKSMYQGKDMKKGGTYHE